MPNAQTNRLNRNEQVSTAAGTPWHAIYTRHQHEKTVAHLLASKGFETFLPLYSEAHRWQDRTKIVVMPLFPCYVFLKGGMDRVLNIITTPGIYSIVSSAGQPSVIEGREIDAIRLALESGAPLQPHEMLKQGDRVRVKSGPLTGVEGILVRHKNICRVVLSVEMLGKAAAVEVDALLLEEIKKAHSGNVSHGGFAAAERQIITVNRAAVMR